MNNVSLWRVHIRQCIARIVVETWLFWSWLEHPREVVSIMIKSNTFIMVDECGEEARDQKNQDWGYYKGEMFSWNMDRWRNTMPIIGDGWKGENLGDHCHNTSPMKQHKLYINYTWLAWNVFKTDIWYEQCSTKHVQGDTCFRETCLL